MGRDARCRGRLPHPVRRAAAVRSAALQRHRRRGVEQRVGRYRRFARLESLPPVPRRAGPRLGRCLGAEGGRRRGRIRRGHASQDPGSGPLRHTGAPRGRLVVRHLQPGRGPAAAPRRGEPTRRTGRAAGGRGGRVAVRRLPRDLHQRNRSTRRGLRRLLRARASRSGRHARRRVHARGPQPGDVGGDPGDRGRRRTDTRRRPCAGPGLPERDRRHPARRRQG